MGDQSISGLFLSPTRMPREEQRCKMLVKMWDIVRDYFSPNYDVASFLNHEQIIKIIESSMKNVLLGNGVSQIVQAQIPMSAYFYSCEQNARSIILFLFNLIMCLKEMCICGQRERQTGHSSTMFFVCKTVFMSWSQIHLTFTKSDFKKGQT